MSREFIDQIGHRVTVSDKPLRIVSLVPSLTELLFDLGLEDRVVGVTRYCVHPEHARKVKAVIGGPKTFKFEAIDGLKPDLIIGNKEENYKEGIEQLQKKYPTWLCEINTLDDALAMIRSVGELTHTETAANQLADAIRHTMSQIPQGRPVRVAYLIWRKPYRVAAANTFINEMLTLCNMENVFAGQQRYPAVTIDDIQAAKPDILLLSSDPFPFSEKHCKEFANAGVKAQCQLVDGEMFCWTGSRLRLSADYFVSLMKGYVQET